MWQNGMMAGESTAGNHNEVDCVLFYLKLLYM